MTDSDGIQKKGVFIDEVADWSATLPLAWSVIPGEATRTIPPRPRTRRGAMEWAIQFALEHPGSTGVILGVTAVSLDMLFHGRNGVMHCLTERMISIYDRRGGLRTPKRTHIVLPNGSQIIGYPSTVLPEKFYGLSINYVLVERGAHCDAWEALTRQLRPLPGIENCIITITDDEADE